MQKRTIISNGKKYLVNVPGWEDGVFVDGGSLSFGSASQYLSVQSSSKWAVSTGSFTVEWWQYQTLQPGGTFPRVFTVDVWPNAELAVSIEGGGDFYPWIDKAGNATAVANGFTITAPYINTWTHFAMVRESGSFMRMYQNGIVMKTITGSAYVTANINNTTKSLLIGGETGANEATTRFPGYITNFRFVNGYALYSASFTSPYSPMPVPGTVFLLNADSAQAPYVYDNSGYNNPIVQNSVSWSSAAP